MIAVIDYDAGNLNSVVNALRRMGADPVITNNPDEILRADKVILPGVGAFGDAMDKLNRFGLCDTIYKCVESGKPFLGICLGLQLMFEYSEEAPGCKGLGIFKGGIKRIPGDLGLKVPHIGWNSLQVTPGAKLFQGLKDNPYVYFVHSYYLQAEDPEIVAATTEYGVNIHASAEKGNVFACQFHPEKSGDVGMQILKNFIEM